jgi:hypothetical protein
MSEQDARRDPKTQARHATRPDAGFPYRGNIFSIVWKKFEKVFHSVEKNGRFFHGVEQPSAEPKPRAKGEREVYREAQRASSERAQRTERQKSFP